MREPQNLEENVGNLLEMEDVSSKKVLDFSGRIVHNEDYLIRQSKRVCCKIHMRTEQNRPPEDIGCGLME